jgi:hypothetical protein
VEHRAQHRGPPEPPVGQVFDEGMVVAFVAPSIGAAAAAPPSSPAALSDAGAGAGDVAAGSLGILLSY